MTCILNESINQKPEDKRELLLTITGKVSEEEVAKYQHVFSTVFTDYEFSLYKKDDDRHWDYTIKIYNLNMLSIVEKIMFSLKFNLR
jgi:hypothetical protein